MVQNTGEDRGQASVFRQTSQKRRLVQGSCRSLCHQANQREQGEGYAEMKNISCQKKNKTIQSISLVQKSALRNYLQTPAEQKVSHPFIVSL